MAPAHARPSRRSPLPGRGPQLRRPVATARPAPPPAAWAGAALGAAALLALLLAVLPAPPAAGATTGTAPEPATAPAENEVSEPTTAATAATAASGLTAAERRGKRIYLHGESASGHEVVALMGDAGIEVPATALPCSSCHGRDGRGRPEGGVEPSDLTWDALTRPYTVTTATGRERGPYTPRLLQRAILLGLDASGNELDTVMPRYRLSREDADDLLAYLRKLGRDHDPGVAEDSLTLGVLLPPEGVPGLDATARAVRSVVDAYAAGVNAGGGVYHRRLRLRYLPLPASPADRPRAVERFLRAEGTFALVASFTAGSDRELADLAEEHGIPLVGPLTLHPDESFPLDRHVFYLDGGLPGSARALVEAAARHREAEGGTAGAVAAVVSPEQGRLATVAAAAAELADERFGRVERVTYPAGGLDAARLVERLRAAGAGDVFLVAPGDAESALLDAAAAASWGPRVHALGNLVGDGLFTPRPGFRGDLHLAFSSLPVDRTPPGLERFHTALGDAAVEPGSTEILAFTAVDLLVDGLERAGRDLSREGLIEALEVLRDHSTGLTRPLSFGPNRRVAVRGAYVVTLDPAEPASPTGVVWVEP